MYAGNVVQLQFNNNIDARTEEQEFLTLLDEFEQQGHYVSFQAAARNYAPRVFSCSRDKRRVYEKVMRRLFEQQRIHTTLYGPRSRHLVRITRAKAEVINFPGAK
jgi:hypothetical protein